MVRGLYSAYTGMYSEQKRLEIISNNVANAATVGYKSEGVTNQSFDSVYTLKIKDATNGFVDERIGSMSLGSKIGEVYTSFDQGSVRQTGNTYDLAMEGKGFFTIAVVDKEGNESIKYTRDGSFKLNSNGMLMDTNGNYVVGESGHIQIPTDAAAISVDSFGRIYADGNYVDSLKITDFADYDYIAKYGENLYEAVDGAEETLADGTILQGYLEQSNVNSVNEMVNMIAVTRSYEANQKVISTIDSMLDKAVNSVGSL